LVALVITHLRTFAKGTDLQQICHSWQITNANSRYVLVYILL